MGCSSQWPGGWIAAAHMALGDRAVHRLMANISFFYKPPGLLSMSLKQSRETSPRENSAQSRQTAKLQGPLRCQIGQREGSSLWLELRLSCLFAKVNWRKAKDIAQERWETAFFLFLFFFSRKTQKNFVEVGTKL